MITTPGILDYRNFLLGVIGGIALVPLIVSRE
jgi:hypothetical protein